MFTFTKDDCQSRLAELLYENAKNVLDVDYLAIEDDSTAVWVWGYDENDEEYRIQLSDFGLCTNGWELYSIKELAEIHPPCKHIIWGKMEKMDMLHEDWGKVRI